MRSLLLTSLLLLPAGAAPLYTVQAVSPAGLVDPTATAISNSGHVTGQGFDAGGNAVAFVYSPGTGPATLTAGTIGDSINANGAIAGSTWTAGGNRATIWANGAAEYLDILDSYATGINDSGTLTGSGMNGSRRSAFVHSGGQTTFVDVEGVWSTANDTNNSGMVAGNVQKANGQFQAFAWSVSGGTVLPGTLGGATSYANAVNDSGIVVGTSTTQQGHSHAFLFNGDMLDLGALGGAPSSALDINSGGTVVGYSYTASGSMRAFVWSGGIMYDLNALLDQGSDWTLEAAYGVNEGGQIVGRGTYRGSAAAFLLDPIAISASPFSSASAVPEPGTWFAVVLGLGILWRARSLRPATTRR